jgi:hypothetical protein
MLNNKGKVPSSIPDFTTINRRRRRRRINKLNIRIKDATDSMEFKRRIHCHCNR